MTLDQSNATATLASPQAPGTGLAVIEARLAERGIPHRRIPVGTGAVIVVSSYGSRVYGPFFDEGSSESWVPASFADTNAFADLHRSGEWNVGGDRVWIGPEIEYMISDRNRHWDTYDMPSALDPGTHVLTSDRGEAVMRRHTRLQPRLTTDAGPTSIDLRIRVRAARDPLRHLDIERDGVRFAGYQTEITLSQLAAAPVPAESWMLLQVLAGGTALVAGAPRMRVTDYYEPVGELLRPAPGGTAVRITGRDRFKIGFAAPHVTGRMGYLRDLDDDQAVLFVRSSPVHAGLDYAEEPDVIPGHRGDALHIYNDDGGLGGFAEMEARGTPVDAVPFDDGTARPITDRFWSWWFRGRRSAVHEIARELVHVDPDPMPEGRNSS